MINEEKILEMLTSIDNRLAKLEAGQAKLESGQANLEAGQANLEAGQAKLESDIQEIKSKISSMAAIQNQHTIFLKKIAHYVDLQASATVSIEERVTRLERIAKII